PVCAPTRASLLTGRYHPRTGVDGVTRTKETMRSEEITIAEILNAAGYTTGCFGKWHNGAHYPHHPNGQGFDDFFGFCAGHWNNYFDTHLEWNGRRVETEGYITDVLTDGAVEFIRANQDRPFLCYVPYNAPHSPWQVPGVFYEKYKNKGLDNKTACAYAMCENVDYNVGRLLDTLDRYNLAEDTIVLFLTDNGPNSDRYNGNMRGRKGSSHEGGIRVPLFVRWPGKIQAGKVIPQIASHIDLLPTLVSLCGIPMLETKPLDGIDLSPLLQGEVNEWKDRMIFTTWGRRGSVRTQRWRAYTQNNRWELYDMAADPDESDNVADKHPQVLKRLSRAYEKWYQEATKAGFDPIPTHIGHPEMRVVTLPGHEAYLQPGAEKGISYVGRSGWANDYITAWIDTDAYPLWEVNIVEEGNYNIELMYSCPKEDVGSKIRVEIGEAHVDGTVNMPHEPPFLPSPDRVPRKEVYEKEWRTLKLGTTHLKKGKTQLKVKALTKPGNQVMELKAVKVETARGYNK
ncbi:sulfatase-like hydrolase/transferase, partial [bacterium]|nr:sulfatase-like hydrolase/transferase [bacterium]